MGTEFHIQNYDGFGRVSNNERCQAPELRGCCPQRMWRVAPHARLLGHDRVMVQRELEDRAPPVPPNHARKECVGRSCTGPRALHGSRPVISDGS